MPRRKPTPPADEPAETPADEQAAPADDIPPGGDRKRELTQRQLQQAIDRALDVYEDCKAAQWDIQTTRLAATTLKKLNHHERMAYATLRGASKRLKELTKQAAQEVKRHEQTFDDACNGPAIPGGNRET